MGVKLYIDCYQKEKTCITGYIKCLNCYEVNLNKIKKYPLFEKDNKLSFKGGIQSIEKLACVGYFNLGGENSFLFYHYANCSISGTMRSENDELFGIMFEPISILGTIKELLLVSNESISDDERENLNRLIQLLKDAVEKDGMVCFSIG